MVSGERWHAGLQLLESRLHGGHARDKLLQVSGRVATRDDLESKSKIDARLFEIRQHGRARRCEIRWRDDRCEFDDKNRLAWASVQDERERRVLSHPAARSVLAGRAHGMHQLDDSVDHCALDDWPPRIQHHARQEPCERLHESATRSVCCVLFQIVHLVSAHWYCLSAKLFFFDRVHFVDFLVGILAIRGLFISQPILKMINSYLESNFYIIAIF